jgi:hypothetical protein
MDDSADASIHSCAFCSIVLLGLPKETEMMIKASIAESADSSVDKDTLECISIIEVPAKPTQILGDSLVEQLLKQQNKDTLIYPFLAKKEAIERKRKRLEHEHEHKQLVEQLEGD